MTHIAYKPRVYNTEIERRAFKYLTGCRNLSPESADREIENAHARHRAKQPRVASPALQLAFAQPRRRATIDIANEQWKALVAKAPQQPTALAPLWRAAA